MSTEEFNWAQAAANLFQSKSLNLNDLVDAAKLDPYHGDLIDADFSGVDLSNQDLSNWDLSNAILKDADLRNTVLVGAKIDIAALVEAKNWKQAVLSKEDEDKVSLFDILHKKINEYMFNYRIFRILKETDITLLGDLVSLSGTDLLRIAEFGERSLETVERSLKEMGLQLGLEVDFWPRSRIEKIYDNPRYIASYAPRLRFYNPNFTVGSSV